MTVVPPFSIRRKLTLAALLPLVVILLLVTLAAFYLINAWIVGETQKRLRNDLNAAREVLHSETQRVEDVVRFSAHSGALIEALDGGDLKRLRLDLEAVRLREGLDILTLAGPRGEILLRAVHPEGPDGAYSGLPFVSRALRGEDYAGAALLDAEELRHEGDDLAVRSAIPLDPLPSTGPRFETRGMFLVGATAVHDQEGTVLGCLYGGVLLNGNLPLVDRIRTIVYGNETYEGTGVGSATIFLDDVRIATTILKGERRALGTRISPQVAAAVLERREGWLARARVIDDWYLTAYEPILAEDGQAIGALYVGRLERPFVELKSRASFILFGLLLLGSLLGSLVAWLVARHLSLPILDLARSAERVAAGERDLVLPVAARDEIGHLTRTFNRMTVALRERDREVAALNCDLERKVEERSALLETKSLQLIAAQEELLRSEKLAAIGSLAAGVAHEINNPAAIIRGNVEILLAELDSGAAGREEGEEILRQTERISRITQGMLDFAREWSIHPEPVAVNLILQEIVEQIGHQVPLGRAEVRLELDPSLPLIDGDSGRLRQVFTNLLVNALQAMNGEGVLRVVSRCAGEEVEIAIADSGPGISSPDLAKIFNPFFTTRQGGTGLGLSVSYGIVQALKGRIEVDSPPGEGATFVVRLPLVQRG